MAKVAFACPHCKMQRELEERWLGHETVCLGCGKPVIVRPEKPDEAAPEAPEGATAEGGEAEPAPARAPKRSEEPEPHQEIAKSVRFHCPECNRRYAFHEGCVGTKFKCYKCSTRMIVLNAEGEVAVDDSVDEQVADAQPRSGGPETFKDWFLGTPVHRLPGLLAVRLGLRKQRAEETVDPAAAEAGDAATEGAEEAEPGEPDAAGPAPDGAAERFGPDL